MISISLIVATYNRAPHLIRALESVVLQNLPHQMWECVVVNNNSKDDTEERFAAFAAAHPTFNLRLVRETQQGLSHARNRGIAECKGQYIAIIDDDERIVEGFLASYASFFDAHADAAVAGGPIVAEYETERPAWMSRYTERPIANPMDFGSEVRPFPAGKIPGGGNMAFRSSVVTTYGAFDPSLGRVAGRLIGGEETDFFERLRRAGEVIWYLPGAVMYHLIPPEKLTEEYFRRLCYNVGVSQRMRSGNRFKMVAGELLKWCATLLLCLTLRPVQSRWLLRMRREITRGLLEKSS